MIANSYTRITLALDIIRRIDSGKFAGYHDLGIVKHQIDLHDIITIEEAPQMALECDNQMVPCDETNICWKAADLLKKEFHLDTNVRINIEKHIPVMGGLAGGSANAATTLSMLNTLWNLNLPASKLMQYGRILGMDVPFYFIGDTAFDSEATEYLVPLPCVMNFIFILAIPDFGVSTKSAYQGINYSAIGKSVHQTKSLISALQAGDRKTVYESMHNDFELSVFPQYPRLGEVKKELLDNGCFCSMMSGSGSTILGITDTIENARDIQNKISSKSYIAASLQKKQENC